MKYPPAINVAIADDHALFRIGLGEILTSFPEINLMYSVGNGQELLTTLEAKKHPDICILDINMPVMDGYTTAKTLKQINPKIKIIALVFFYTLCKPCIQYVGAVHSVAQATQVAYSLCQ